MHDGGAGATENSGTQLGPPSRPRSIDFHFDVMCPYAYQTSLWIREVRDQIGLTINWRFFSLEEVNRVEGKKHPWEREWSYGWSMMRIGALLRRHDMMDLDRWYQAAGHALHIEGLKPHVPEVARALLENLGLDPALVDAAIADPTTNDEVLAEHRRVIDASGYGVPTLFFPDGQCFFGPVLLEPPSGPAALRLFDAVVAWTEFPHLYELQRPKTQADDHLILETFRPYIEARDWVSMNRGEVLDFSRPRPGEPEA
ncbi:MAG: DsbA family protein [Actinomycetes bacterium]